MTIGNPYIPKGASDDLMTVDELSALLKASRATVYRMVERREIPFIRFRGFLRFSRSQVNATLEGKAVGPMDEKCL